jgi:hypothetical protein
MAEIAVEQSYANRSEWPSPISETHTFGEMTLRAASDYARTFADALGVGDRGPVYGHLVLVRAALEACVVSWWLNEPGIDPAERIKRGLCEHLYSANEIRRLNIQEDAAERVERWERVASNLGWRVGDDRGRPVVDGVKRPSIPGGIAALLVGERESRIGRLLWSYLSAVSHVTWFGIGGTLSRAGEPDPAGFVRATIGTQSSSVSTQAWCILRSLKNAATARFTLMGWNDPQWEAACRRVEAHELVLFRAVQANAT